MTRYERHEMLVINTAGRKRLLQEALATHPSALHLFLEDLFKGRGGKKPAPGIVRRSENRREGAVAVGFAHWKSSNEERLKIAAFVSTEEIAASTTPYALMKERVSNKNGAEEAFSEIAEFPAAQKGQIGVVGSVAMEIITGMPYINSASDLDLLIRNACHEESEEWYHRLVAAGKKYNVAVDVEVILANGYGVKAAELFSRSSTLLGKSLHEVRLLDRQMVLNSMLISKV